MFTVNTIQTLFYFSSGGQSGSDGRPEPVLPELAGKRSFRTNRLGPYFSANSNSNSNSISQLLEFGECVLFVKKKKPRVSIFNGYLKGFFVKRYNQEPP